MKKVLSLLLLALPMAFAFTSCDDDDDLPNVTMSITVENAVQQDGIIYVVQGDTLVIEGITVTNNEKGNAAITAATYYWDYYRLGTNIVAPYGYAIVTTRTEDNIEGTPLGNHLLEIQCPLLAEDKAVATALMVYKVCVVESADDIPATGTTTFAVQPSMKKG